MSVRRLIDLDFRALRNRNFFPSPEAWEDQVLYFLMLDRFSDGRETGYIDNDGRRVTSGSTRPFEPADAGGVKDDADRWSEAGGRFVGGTLKGLASKIGYLKRLGVTAIWVSPIFKQVSFKETYHGYGIQNFLEVDPHFGSRDDLKEMVHTAHAHGIRVILDIILNHTGDVFAYDADRYRVPDGFDPRWDSGLYRVKGFRAKDGTPSLPFGPISLDAHPEAWPDGALWPAELQDASVFTRKGRINNWDFDPEFLEGDFLDLKNVTLGRGSVDSYEPSLALVNLCKVYQFWIADADVDGFRVDTVKHMDLGATRYFTSVIHEFAESIGKERFYLIGEITGGRQRAYETLEVTGMDAALGLDDIPDKLEYLVKGYRDPSEYFDLFRNSLLLQKDSHVWFKNKVVTLYDDHDQVRKGPDKARFCAVRDGDRDGPRLALNALALNATTLGIPCIYYGSEQCFNGNGPSDRYIREAMFGGEFGAFRSRHRHFFDEESRVYKELGKILAFREHRIALRRGRQYLRQISGDGVNFGLPHMIGGQIRSVVPWSRLFADAEMVLAINTDPIEAKTAWVTVDAGLHPANAALTCIYSTDSAQVGHSARLEARNGKAFRMTVPAAGFVMYE